MSASAPSSGIAPQSVELIADDVLPKIGEVPAVGPAILRAPAAASALSKLGLSDRNPVDRDLREWFLSATEGYFTLVRGEGIARGSLEQAVRSARMSSGETVDDMYRGQSIANILDALQTLYTTQGEDDVETILRLNDSAGEAEDAIAVAQVTARQIFTKLVDLAPENATAAQVQEFRKVGIDVTEQLRVIMPSLAAAADATQQIEDVTTELATETEPVSQSPNLLPPSSASAVTGTGAFAGVQGPLPDWFGALKDLTKTPIAKGPYNADLKPDWKPASTFVSLEGRNALTRLAVHTRDERAKALLYAIADGNKFPTGKFPVANADRQRFLDTTKNAILLAYRIEWGKTPTVDDEENYLAGNGKVWLDSFREVKDLSTWVKRVEKVGAVDVE